jgi:hypothetical protein
MNASKAKKEAPEKKVCMNLNFAHNKAFLKYRVKGTSGQPWLSSIIFVVGQY